MSSSLLARMMVTSVAGGQGITPLFIDLNRTHATNPLWPGHARFHVVWQTFTVTLASFVELALIWWPPFSSRLFFYLAALLSALPMCGFIVAMLARKIYSGTLHDPNGIQPVRFSLAGKTREVDMNVVLVFAGAGILVSAVLLF